MKEWRKRQRALTPGVGKPIISTRVFWQPGMRSAARSANPQGGFHHAWKIGLA